MMVMMLMIMMVAMMIICDDDSDDDEIYERDLGADAYSSARLDLGDRREIGRMKDFLK